MDKWLIRTVMGLHTEACTAVRTDDGLIESCSVKLGLHQGYTVVSSEARSGLQWNSLV